MISNDKLIDFVKRWRELETRRSSYEYDLAVLMRDIRGCFVSGAEGDRQFSTWVSEELRMGAPQAEDMLRRANAATVVPDAQAWSAHGSRQVMRLAELPTTKRVAALNQVRATGYALSTVLNRMQAAQPRTAGRFVSASSDAATMAEYIQSVVSSQGLLLPTKVEAAVARHVKKTSKQARPAVVVRRAKPRSL